MISDALAGCVGELDRYLNDQIFDDSYHGDLRDRVIRLRNEAEYLRALLDAPPGVQLPPKAVLLDRIEAQRARKVEERCYVLASEAEALGWCTPKKDAKGCS